MMMLIEALDEKDNIDDDDGDNYDDDGEGEGRLVAVLGTVHLPSTTFHYWLLMHHCTAWATMHHNALLSHIAKLQHYFL